MICFAQHFQSLYSLLIFLRLTLCCFDLLRTSSSSARCSLVFVSMFHSLCCPTPRVAVLVLDLSPSQSFFLCFSQHLVRHILAILHFNENVNREKQKDKYGTTYYNVVYPKYKFGKDVVLKIAVPPKYSLFTAFLCLEIQVYFWLLRNCCCILGYVQDIKEVFV